MRTESTDPAGSDPAASARGGQGGALRYPGGLTEATVVGRAQEGDLDAFELIVRRYQDPLFRLALRMLGDRAEAEDVVQDSLVQVWRKLVTLTELDAFRGWVYQIATRRCLDLLRARSRRRTEPTVPETLAEFPDVGSDGDPQAAVERHEQWRGLEHSVRQLPDEQRACWILRELHGFSYAEISFVMRLPASTVRGRIARARRSLVKGMQSWR